MNIVANVFMIIAALVLPIAAAVWLCLKKKGYLKPVLLGVLCFGFFQVLTRIPVMTLVLPKTAWYNLFSQTQPFLLALFAGGTAGLFEEGGRWIVMSLFMKNKRRLNDGIAFGVGHGGLEAVLLVGINAVATLILNDYSKVTALQLLAGGFERICTLVIHIAFSVMVLKSVTLKKPVWLLLAFLLHTVIDMTAVLLAQARASTLTIEGVVLVFTLALLGYIIFECKKHKGGEIQCQRTES